MTHPLPQASGYSGGSHEGINLDASYHRLTYENRQTLLTPTNFLKNVGEILEIFKRSSRSRLVIRSLLKADKHEIQELEERIIQSCGGTLSYYPDYSVGGKNIWYITYSHNREDRNPNNQTQLRLREINRAYRARILEEIGDFKHHALTGLERFRNQGYRLTKDIEAEELAHLWIPFGWSTEACEETLGSKEGDFVLGVRNHRGLLVASILYNHQPHILDDGRKVEHGELTESSTLPQYRGQGIMSTLATALHVEALHRGNHNVYGEYRALGTDATHSPQSIRYALQSGVEFHSSELLYNHVDIGGDLPEPHNHNRTIDGYGDSASELRTFSLGSLNPEKICHTVRDHYLSLIHS
ncbi:MAG: hypothetical protein HHAS10_01040 [Candidatus Altimarinota bacterium]